MQNAFPQTNPFQLAKQPDTGIATGQDSFFNLERTAIQTADRPPEQSFSVAQPQPSTSQLRGNAQQPQPNATHAPQAQPQVSSEQLISSFINLNDFKK